MKKMPRRKRAARLVVCLLTQAVLLLSPLQCIHDAIHPLYAPFVEP